MHIKRQVLLSYAYKLQSIAIFINAARLPKQIHQRTSNMSHLSHQNQPHCHTANFALLTISDTRNQSTDKSGQLIKTMLEKASQTLVAYQIVKDEPQQIKHTIDHWHQSIKPDIIITTGGTGLASRDNTVPIIKQFIKQEIVGFGEIFRMLSYQQIGPAAILSRALAGKRDHAYIFALPGSTNAVKLALEKIIIPQISHLIYEKNR